jgi:hypothetical protein
MQDICIAAAVLQNCTIDTPDRARLHTGSVGSFLDAQ